MSGLCSLWCHVYILPSNMQKTRMTRTIALNFLSLALSLVALSFLGSCSGDPAPKHFLHYYHPTLSADGTFLFAGYENFSEGETGTGSNPNFFVKDLATGAQTPIFLPGFAARDRYWLEPASSSIVLSAVNDTSPGFRFHARTGALLGVYSVEKYAVHPQAMEFQSSGTSFLWAGASDGRVKIGRVSYSSQPWKPDQEALIIDTLFDASVHDVCFTSDVTFACYLSNGIVREYNMSGALLHLFRLNTRRFEDLWQAQLKFKESLGERRMFALDDSGIVMMDISEHRKSVITSGIVKQFDANPSTVSDLMAYETRSGDVWTAYIDGPPVGLPRSRLRQQHAPHFSFDGNLLVTVSWVNAETDSLAIRKSPFLY